MDVAVFAVYGIAALTHEHGVDLARGLAGTANGYLSTGSTGHSPTSLLARHLSSPHDRGSVGFDGAFGHLVVVVCRQFGAVGIRAIWSGAVSELAIGLSRRG